MNRESRRLSGIPMWQVASGSYFEVLGVKAALGRVMTAEDEKLDTPIPVISDRYWRRRFGADPAAIGKTISFRKRTFTIVGVTPPEFWGMQPGTPVDVTLPITVERPHLAESGNWWLQAIVAHLRPGVPESQAQAEADALYQSFLPESQLPAGVIRKYFQRFQKSCRNESKSNQTGSYESQVKYVPAGTWPAYCGPGDGLRS